MKCSCSECETELSSVEARSPEKICDFCDACCFPLGTYSGQEVRVTMSQPTRQRFHQMDALEDELRHRAGVPDGIPIPVELRDAAMKWGAEWLKKRFKL